MMKYSKAAMEEITFLRRQLIKALTMLTRIRRRYPYIFTECVCDDEIDYVTLTYRDYKESKSKK